MRRKLQFGFQNGRCCLLVVLFAELLVTSLGGTLGHLYMLWYGDLWRPLLDTFPFETRISNLADKLDHVVVGLAMSSRSLDLAHNLQVRNGANHGSPTCRPMLIT